ncbi:reverse transcriptase domain-containing protein [Tanacetum coccineum]
MSTQQDINVIRAQRLANTHDPLALMANTQTPFHPDHSSHITYIQHPQPNTNYMPQPMQNPEDSSDPTTTMNTALALLAKAFKVNTIPINNNQRSSLIPCNSQITQSGMNMSQDIKIQMVDDNVGNQYRNRDVVTAPNEGNCNGIIGNPIRCYNCRGEGHYASNCIVKSRKRDVAYLQQQLQIAQEEEAGIQSTQEECEFMAAYAYKETERVKLNCTSDDTLQQASTSGTQSNNAPVYDSDGSTEVPKDENCYDHDIFNMLTYEVQYTDTPNDLDRAKKNLLINTCNTKIKWLQAPVRRTHGNSSDTQCASNTLDPVSLILEDENMSLEFQQSILVKPPSSFYKPKLYSVTPFPKSSVLPKVDKTNALSKPVTSNSAPSTRELKVVQTVSVIAPRIFRTNPSKTSRVDNVIPNKPVETSVMIKPITVSQPNVIHKQQANSDSNGFSSTKVNNTAKTRRPHPRSNSNTDGVPSKSKITANHNVCVLNYVNDVNSRADNQTANVSIRENQKKHKANAKKSNKLGSTGSLASSRPSKPRTCLRWIPIGRIFAMYGKLTTSSNTENKSEKSMCDNASTSNPLKPSSKGFSNSASLLGRLSRLRKQHTSIYPIVVL